MRCKLTGWGRSVLAPILPHLAHLRTFQPARNANSRNAIALDDVHPTGPRAGQAPGVVGWLQVDDVTWVVRVGVGVAEAGHDAPLHAGLGTLFGVMSCPK